MPDEKIPNLNDKMEQVLEKGRSILSKIKDGDVVVAMAIEGDRWKFRTTRQKRWIPSRFMGRSSMVFVIGGSLGLSPA